MENSTINGITRTRNLHNQVVVPDGVGTSVVDHDVVVVQTRRIAKDIRSIKKTARTVLAVLVVTVLVGVVAVLINQGVVGIQVADIGTGDTQAIHAAIIDSGSISQMPHNDAPTIATLTIDHSQHSTHEIAHIEHFTRGEIGIIA